MTKKNQQMKKRGTNGSFSNRANLNTTVTAPLARRPILRLGSTNRQISATNRGVRVRNCEQLDYAISTTTTTSYGVIPVGSVFVPFKWLTSMAQLYSFYRIHRIRVHLFSTCPATQRGDVTLAWCPDMLDATAWATAANATYVFNMPVVTGGPCWAGDGNKSLTLDIGPTDLTIHTANPWKRIGSYGSDDGLSQVYAGAILCQLGANQSGASQGVGNIFVEYDIEFAESANPTINSFGVNKDGLPDGGIRWSTGPSQDPTPPNPTPPSAPPPSSPKPF